MDRVISTLDILEKTIGKFKDISTETSQLEKPREKKYFIKATERLGIWITHVIPVYLGGRDWEDHGSRPGQTWQKVSETLPPSQKISQSQLL
jgi:hypothetical protein